MAKSHSRIELGRAFHAARILASNPDDLPQVFTIIEALSGSTMERMLGRMGKSETGRKLLEERPDIVEVLADRESLRKLPEGSLGRAYLQFVESENISAEGIRDASAHGMTGQSELPDEHQWIHQRMRDTHDLWHAAVGYKGDVLGETALLAFSLAQTFNPAIALIIGIGLVKTIGKPEARKVILDGFRRGNKAKWLVDQDWASMLALPVDEVRRRLSLESPPVYDRVNSSDLKAAAAAA